MRFSTFILSSFLVASCGSSDGSGGGDNGFVKDPTESPGGSQDGTSEDATEWDGYHYDIYDKEGNKIPLHLTPSLLEDGKLVDSCKEGQIPYLDQCFDEIHIDTAEPGFTLIKDNGEVFVASLEVSDDWLSKFGSHEPMDGHVTHRHKITYGCKYDCPLPSFLKMYFDTFDIGEKTYISFLQVDTSYFFGRKRYNVENHLWLIKGSITILGRKFDLPITKGQIQPAFPSLSISIGGTIETETLNVGLAFFQYGKWYSPNPSEQYLHSVHFTVNKNSLREALSGG